MISPAKFKSRYLGSPSAIASAAAVELHGLLQRHVSGLPFGIALSGGRIAKSFYEEVVQSCRKAPVDFENVHFFWADERCVPPLDPESNYLTAQTFLFQPLEIPVSNIHRIFGEADPAYACAQAEAELCRIMPLDENGQPRLDLVILGMGEDGHVASLFPGEPEEMITDGKVYRSVIAVKPPPQRITLGYAPIFAARECWVLASGEGKKAAYERLEQGDASLPIARIVSGRSETLIFQDIKAR